MTTWKKQNSYVPPVQYKKFNAEQIGGEYNILFPVHKTEKEIKNEKLENFKSRLRQFSSVQTLQDAKELLDKIMPIALDRTTLYIGDAKVIIINYEKRLRICLNSPKEFISYDFI